MKILEKFSIGPVLGVKAGSWPFGRPYMYSHCYLIDGLLVDTGHRDMRMEILNILSQNPVNQIFTTHHHEDHSGNVNAFIKEFECPAYATEICIDLMKSPPPISFLQWLTWGKAEPCLDLKPVDERIITDNYQFDVIPSPGHAIDMACLFEPNEGWLFSADLFVNSRIKFFKRDESLKQQIESIQRILQLNFDVLFCGHNPQKENGKEKLEKKLQFFEDFYGKAQKLFEEGHPIGKIIKAMELKEKWFVRFVSGGEISARNMIRSVIRDLDRNSK